MNIQVLHIYHMVSFDFYFLNGNILVDKYMNGTFQFLGVKYGLFIYLKKGSFLCHEFEILQKCTS